MATISGIVSFAALTEPFASLLISFGLVKQEQAARYGWVLFYVPLLICAGVLIHFYRVELARVTSRLWRNVQLLLFGQIALHEQVGKLHAAADAIDVYREQLNDIQRRVFELHRMTEAALFARVAGLEGYRGDNYHILYTHKGKHPLLPGPEEQYRIPGFPFDEADGIMRVWYHAAQNLGLTINHIRPLCGCAIENQNLWKNILKDSYAVIGSPKGNAACRALMKKLEEMAAAEVFERPPYLMTTQPKNQSTEELCFLSGDVYHSPLKPDSTKKAFDGQKLTDYAMLMKLPNVFYDAKSRAGRSILVMAGCKVAGQVALSDWLSHRKNLADLEDEFSGGDFYVVFEVDYVYKTNKLPETSEPRRVMGGGLTFHE